MGPELVFLVLNLTKECQKKRIEMRHPGSEEVAEIFNKMFDGFEPAGNDEPNAYNVTIEDGMSPDDVLKTVVDIISNNK